MGQVGHVGVSIYMTLSQPKLGKPEGLTQAPTPPLKGAGESPTEPAYRQRKAVPQAWEP